MYLYRALTVAFVAPRADYPADAALIVCGVDSQSPLFNARDWVLAHLSQEISRDRILWHCFDPSFEAIFLPIPASVEASANVPLNTQNATLVSFIEALKPIFK
jgi:hypothetical protein